MMLSASLHMVWCNNFALAGELDTLQEGNDSQEKNKNVFKKFAYVNFLNNTHTHTATQA